MTPAEVNAQCEALNPVMGKIFRSYVVLGIGREDDIPIALAACEHEDDREMINTMIRALSVTGGVPEQIMDKNIVVGTAARNPAWN
jgi:hypothetical protein